MKVMNPALVQKINSALRFSGQAPQEPAPLRPWQYVQMEYDRVGLVPPPQMPDFASIEDAQIWMCLDVRYNRCLMAERYPAAV